MGTQDEGLRAEGDRSHAPRAPGIGGVPLLRSSGPRTTGSVEVLRIALDGLGASAPLLAYTDVMPKASQGTRALLCERPSPFGGAQVVMAVELGRFMACAAAG